MSMKPAPQRAMKAKHPLAMEYIARLMRHTRNAQRTALQMERAQ